LLRAASATLARVVSNYRAAQLIAIRDASGEADTEELRKAVIHYRTLFDELLGVKPVAPSSVPADRGVLRQYRSCLERLLSI